MIVPQRGLIVGSGFVQDPEILRGLVTQHDHVLCADGGAKHFRKMGLIPDALIGDLDSIAQEDLDYMNEKEVPILEFPARKDYTDSELAIRAMTDEGIREITLIGGTGSRLDHTLSNALLLQRFYEDGVYIILLDGNNLISVLPEQIRVPAGFPYLSLLALDRDGLTVTMTGVEYPLEEGHIPYGTSLGVSNRIVEDFAEITLHSGRGWLIRSADGPH